MDLTNDEIEQLLDEVIGHREALITLSRAEFAKAPTLKTASDDDERAALFVTRISALLQTIRAQLDYPKGKGGWVSSDRLRNIFLSTCGLVSDHVSGDELDAYFQIATDLALNRGWMEHQRVDEWHPGMRSGAGWVKKYSATPLGKRQISRIDQAHSPTAIEAVKPPPPVPAPIPPWWRKPDAAGTPTPATPTANVTAFAAVKNDVIVAPQQQVVVHVHLPPPPAVNVQLTASANLGTPDGAKVVERFDGIRRLSLPATYQWENVAFVIIDDETFKVLAGSTKTRFNIRDVGLVDRRTATASGNRNWFLLRRMADEPHVLASTEEDEVTKKEVSALRQWLREFTGINGEPLKPFVSGLGWRPKFKVMHTSFGDSGDKSPAEL